MTPENNILDYSKSCCRDVLIKTAPASPARRLGARNNSDIWLATAHSSPRKATRQHAPPPRTSGSSPTAVLIAAYRLYNNDISAANSFSRAPHAITYLNGWTIIVGIWFERLIGARSSSSLLWDPSLMTQISCRLSPSGEGTSPNG